MKREAGELGADIARVILAMLVLALLAAFDAGH
jgi:hypothetical protein